MSVRIALPQSTVLAAACAWLETLFDPPFEAVIGQVNEVPQPTSEDFAIVTPLQSSRLATNLSSYDHAANTRTATMRSRLTVQTDIYGPRAADNAGVAATMFRDLAAVDWFRFNIAGVRPLHADEARQSVFLDEARRYLDRWTLDLTFQVNLAAIADQQFATELKVDFKGVP
jgi:hypothetical protein